ncbi:Chaperone protein DnaJ [Senna tora]|uniref:Chaperone protein DnaJ n=1 Tax=Senna tora TaxID=362788 RepID=A0A834X5Y0_9FABA|nr:Chaperone protein DnaJ [Senna tora]
MECNKDDAMRAKELSEKKFLEMDFAGAKRFALKAQDLYPCLDGLSQLLATLEVYVSAEKKINGEVDWYEVLGVDPLADDETIRRRYRKLALALHPDKNKSVGSDGAFKLISQAWSLFSNKSKRFFYDQKRNLRGIYEGISNGKPSGPANQNGFFNFFNTANWKDANHRTAAHPEPTPSSPVSLKQTFWTICGACRTQFEYPGVYLNCNLICNCCHKPFLASEIPAPPMHHNAPFTHNPKKKFKSTRLEENNFISRRMPTSSINSCSFSMPGGISSVQTSASSAAEALGAFGVSSEHLKRGHEDAPVKRGEIHCGNSDATKTTASSLAFHSTCFSSNSVLKGDRPRKRKTIDECRVDREKQEVETKMASQTEGKRLAAELGSKKGSIEIGRVNAAANCKRNGMRDLPQQQLKIMLMEKARNSIRSKLNEWNAASVSRKLTEQEKPAKEVREKDNERERNAEKHGAEEFVDSKTIAKKSPSADPDISTLKVADSLTMSVPDPDFHDFDNDRTEKSFGENQVWAAYDDDDGMPRYYALIHSVISLKPFKLRMSWLNSKSNDELAPIKWVSYGFPKTSGDFRIGKYEFNGSLNSFSHRIKWTKGARGVVHIYPKKGDVWALYRNWSLDWNELTPDDIVQKYDMVEVLEDYNEERGVNVAPLVKVAGFKTVFRRHVDPSKIKSIPREEMFRLSHQVPSFLLTGQESHNAPRGCLELDPAAMPMELLDLGKEDPKQEAENSEDRLGLRESSVEDIQRKVVDETMRKENRLENLIVYTRKRVRDKKVLGVAIVELPLNTIASAVSSLA